MKKGYTKKRVGQPKVREFKFHDRKPEKIKDQLAPDEAHPIRQRHRMGGYE